MENKFFKSITDVLAVIFAPMGVIYLIIGTILFSTTKNSGVDHEARTVGIVFMLLSLPFLAVGCGFIVKAVLKRHNMKRLKQEGERIFANIVEVNYSHHVRINNRSLQFLVCSYSMDGKTYVFKSNFLKFNPLNLSENNSKVAVYFDPNNIKNYYVDCNSLLSEEMVYL